jgi:predicted ATPase/transcriptional regulator with XRE-family HTH domain
VLDSAKSQSFGALLRQHRLAAGLTQAALAERSGIADRTIQDLERGAARPRRATAQRLAEALGLLPEARSELEAVTSAPRRRRRAGWVGAVDVSETPPESGPARPGHARRATSPGARPNTLPIPPTALLGRERELSEVAMLLRGGARLVTLTGPGGVGKTRLAVEVAAAMADEVADGVVLAELASLGDSALVATTIGRAFGLHEQRGRTAVEGLRAYVAGRRLLLLLDNFEHVVEAAPLVADLLASSPGLLVLVTSREPLRLRGEREYDLLPLAVPSTDDLAPSADLARSPAVALFVERAAAIRSGFSVTGENASAIAEICARLDGLPLAIELAAARIRTLTPQALVERLERRLPLLTGGARDLPARQQTLRDTIAWSHDLLDANEQRLFRRLAVFVGGWAPEAAEAVCVLDDPDVDVIGGLESLASKSLTRRRDDPDGNPRFGMLETVREYALEQLEVSGEVAHARRCHATYWLNAAEAAQPELFRQDQRSWRVHLQANHDNVRAALAWTLSPSGCSDVQVGLRLTLALFRFWHRGDHVREGRQWVARALAVCPSSDLGTRATLLHAAGSLARAQGSNAPARSYFEASAVIYRQVGDRSGTASALRNLANVIRSEGHHERAVTLLDECMTTLRELGERAGLAHALSIKGALARDAGDHDLALSAFEESLSLARESGDLWNVAARLADLGRLAHEHGEHERASSLFSQHLGMRQDVGDRRGIAWSLVNLAWVACDQGEYQRSGTLYRQSMLLYRKLGHQWGPIVCLEGLARLQAATGGSRQSAVLFGAAEAGRQVCGELLPPFERTAHERMVAVARAALGEETFDEAWARGSAMTLEQAVEFALATSRIQ